MAAELTPVLCASCEQQITFPAALDRWTHAELPAGGHDAVPQKGAGEWLLTPGTLWDLFELIATSKPHYGGGFGDPVEVDGLTIWPHGPRVWVRFGQLIRRDARGRYTVHPAPSAQESSP
ncbi:hypothetical protein [Kitasatospora sp. McL0602]|uniref:hypothetical protein n=1 Tax=Kitasatospora sp. McL0602 TaxID=3439530 RepID=UPI003F8CC51E